MTYYTKHVFVCTNQKAGGKVCCGQAGGDDTFNYLKTKLHELGLYGPGQYRVSKSGCLGRCQQGPCLVIYPEGIWYTYSSLADVDEIISNYLMKGITVRRLLIETDKQG